jgi:hypothetical protein
LQVALEDVSNRVAVVPTKKIKNSAAAVGISDAFDTSWLILQPCIEHDATAIKSFSSTAVSFFVIGSDR